MEILQEKDQDYSPSLLQQKPDEIYLQLTSLRDLDEFENRIREFTNNGNYRRLAESILEIRTNAAREITNFVGLHFPDLDVDKEVIIKGWKDFRYHQQLLFIEERLAKL